MRTLQLSKSKMAILSISCWNPTAMKPLKPFKTSSCRERRIRQPLSRCLDRPYILTESIRINLSIDSNQTFPLSSETPASLDPKTPLTSNHAPAWPLELQNSSRISCVKIRELTRPSKIKEDRFKVILVKTEANAEDLLRSLEKNPTWARAWLDLILSKRRMISLKVQFCKH